MHKILTLTPTISQRLAKLTALKADLRFLGRDINDYDQETLFVAIVGTRKPTAYGKEVTRMLARELSINGVVIVSGLALGIDSLAHQAAIDGGGKTIAVLPSGLDNVYPATHRKLSDDIISNGGTLVSEYPDKHTPRLAEFLERNRLIAALSDMVIVIEATTNSGSLNTAGHARRAGIPIGAVPGPITNPMNMGTNHLLTVGAKAITSVNDILDVLGIKQTEQRSLFEIPQGSNEQENKIITALMEGVSCSDELQQHAGLSTGEFLMNLSMLEIAGTIKQNSHGLWSVSVK